MIPHEHDVSLANRDLIEHAFRLAGIDNTTNTAEQDLHIVTEYTLAMYIAQAEQKTEPEISDELIAAAQRTTIRTLARGHSFTYVFALANAIEAKEDQLNAAWHASDDRANPAEFLDRLFGTPSR